MNDSSSNTPVLRSELSHETEMEDLIRMFVDEIPQRIQNFRCAWDRGNLDEVRRLAHQLKGAAPGYGFTPLGTSAGALESALKQADHDLSAVRIEFKALIQLCSRVAY
ncbi:MAG: Hpt domain-containing protein [Phycisphaerae bacterium]|nr:Hpt domain-containing protein [Phycisphaerae bacterium]